VVGKEVYEYAHLLHTNTATDQPQDIIFISYDEPQADENFQLLKHRFPHTKRLTGITGMQRALEQAARISDTPWYYAVFAKTRVSDDFHFDFVPDYFQEPKHYIFDCINNVNGLCYGHMGIIMYNCGLILDNIDREFGLDYTLSHKHASVPVTSCISNFDTSPYQTWRTAFREGCKIPWFLEKQPSMEGQYRLHTWLNKAQGPHAQWCIQGARDGHAYYQHNKSDFNKLKLSFDWQWLREYFVSLHGDIQ
jgi:hypothetical protein